MLSWVLSVDSSISSSYPRVAFQLSSITIAAIEPMIITAYCHESASLNPISWNVPTRNVGTALAKNTPMKLNTCATERILVRSSVFVVRHPPSAKYGMLKVVYAVQNSIANIT